MQTKAQVKKSFIYTWKHWVWLPIVLFVPAISLLIVGSFQDWNISKALAQINNQGKCESAFGDIINYIGCLPIFILGMLSTCIIYHTAHHFIKHEKWIIVVKVCIFIVAMGCLAMGFRVEGQIFAIPGALDGSNAQHIASFWITVLIISFLITGIVCFSFRSFSSETLYRLMPWAIVCIIICVLDPLCAEMLKIAFPRERYREIFKTGDAEADFKNWYELWGATIPSNVDNKLEWTSFPSGHVAYSCTIMTIMALPLVLRTPKRNIGIVLCFVCPMIWVYLVAFGRINAGAHYMSDTMFSITLDSIFFMLTQFVFLQTKWAKRVFKIQQPTV